MAAVNKNFVVKNGIEVGDNLIYGDKTTLRVGIGTTTPGSTLEVRGGIGATNVSVGQILTANVGIITSLTATNTTFGQNVVFRTGIGTELTISGVTTTSNLNVSGVATITTLNTTNLSVSDFTATANKSIWAQVGLGLTFTTGIGTNLSVSGITTLGVTTVTQLSSTGIITASSFVPSSGYIKAPDGTNSFYIYSGTGNVAFQGTIGVSQVNSSGGNKVVGFAGSDALFENNVSIAQSLTASNLRISGIASVGTGITLRSNGDASYAGIISAFKFVGDGSGLTGTISGIGIRSDGVTIGTGVTFVDFTGPGVSTVTVSAGIATIAFEGGGGGIGIQSAGSQIGTGITQLNFIGAGNTFRVTGGTVDVSISGGGGIGIQSAGSQIGTGVTQLNFIGVGNTFRFSSGTVDVSISGGAGGVAINTSGGNVGYSVTTLDLRGSGISTVTVSSGIATINIVSPPVSKFSPVNYIIS